MKNVENTDQDFVRPVDLDHEAGSVIYPGFVLFSLLFLLFLLFYSGVGRAVSPED